MAAGPGPAGAGRDGLGALAWPTAAGCGPGNSSAVEQGAPAVPDVVQQPDAAGGGGAGDVVVEDDALVGSDTDATQRGREVASKRAMAAGEESSSFRA